MYRQLKGGSIGLRATGSVSKMTMDEWMEIFERILTENGVEIFILTKYVDDVLIICRTLSKDQFWDGARLVVRTPEEGTRQEHTLR